MEIERTTNTHFVYRLIPPRPTFDQDMTDAEREIMGRHAEYYAGVARAGKVVVYGPVKDGTGVWGLGVLEVSSEAEAREIAEGDPAVSSGMSTYELGIMPATITRHR
jgi:uncharacterized protein YciI